MGKSIAARHWTRLLECVRKGHPDLWQVWFAELKAGELNGGQLAVQAGDPERTYYLEASCRQAFAEAAQAVWGRLVSVKFVGPAAEDGGAAPAVGPRPEQVNPATAPLAIDEPIKFSGAYTFENFVIGAGNRLAHAAAMAVAESPGLAYNPLFIHGSVGLGKTHLLQAICQGILQRKPDARLCYLSCDSFINHLIAAVEQGDLNSFRYRYRHVDVLVIDDVHFLGEGEHSQEEFFHTFNTLYQSQKQIVLSSDCPPAEIPALEERLVSRFSWGLVARIDPPNYETRVAIVKKKAKLRGLSVPDDVACLIAARVESNIREIEGALNKVLATAQVQGGPLAIDLAREALGDSVQARAAQEISIQRIMEVVIGRYNVRMADLQSKKRSRSIAFPRKICMYLARQLTDHSLNDIGGYFGGRDHTTVLHAWRTVNELRRSNPQLEAALNQMTQTIQGGGQA